MKIHEEDHHKSVLLVLRNVRQTFRITVQCNFLVNLLSEKTDKFGFINNGPFIQPRGVRRCLFKRLFAFKIGKIDLNIKRLNGILFKTVRLLCLKGPECLTRLESLKQNRFKQIMHHDV